MYARTTSYLRQTDRDAAVCLRCNVLQRDGDDHTDFGGGHEQVRDTTGNFVSFFCVLNSFSQCARTLAITFGLHRLPRILSLASAYRRRPYFRVLRCLLVVRQP